MFAFDVPDGVVAEREEDIVKGFENAVHGLVEYAIFKQTDENDNPSSLFFHVLDFEVRHNVIEFLPPRNRKQQAGPFRAVSGSRCKLDVYHYYPQAARPSETARKTMKVSSASDLIEFMGDTELIVDSEYDVKSIEFQVEKSSTPHVTSLDLSVLAGDSKTEHAKISLPISIRPSLILLKLQLALITLGVSSTALIALVASAKPITGWAIVAVLVSGFVIALATTFGFKRGL